MIGRSTTIRLGPLVAGVTLFGCWCDTPETTRMEWVVLGHRAPLQKPSGERVMAIVRLDDDGTEYRIDPSRARGFEGKWGTRYTLELTSSDAPRFIDVAALPSTHFDKILTQTPVAGARFRLHMFDPRFLAEDGRSFVDGQAFDGPDEVCAALDQHRGDPDARLDLHMRHGANGALELLEVRPGTCRYGADCVDRERSWCCQGQCGDFETMYAWDDEAGTFKERPECLPGAAASPEPPGPRR